ncbi:MAG: PEP/pyruvate-binding domain-containing protein [Bacteroidota bacterium]
MRSEKKIFFLILFLAIAVLILQLVYRHYRIEKVSPNDQAFLHTLNSFSEFQQFAGAPLDDAYPGITSVKAVYDLRRKEIYFINSHLYRLHYDFCSKVLGYQLGLRLFNIANYGNQRDYYLANINYLEKDKRFVLEFGSSDEIDSLQIIEMYEQVSKNTFFKNELRLLLNNTNTIHYFEKQPAIPTCDLSALNGGLSYQAIQEGVCVGRLVICEDLKARYLFVRPGDILIVRGTPAEIPLCKAIISDCFQTPLSHIQVLSHNKNMPSAYLKNVFTNENIKKYDGKIVSIAVNSDTVLITMSAENVTMLRPEKQVLLPLHSTIKSIVPISQCGTLTNADIGTKAKGLSDLKIISEENEGLFRVPEGAFVIPFYFYKQHLQQAKIEPLLLALKQCELDQTARIDSLLSRIRAAIKNTALSAELLREVNEQISSNNNGTSYRFRSSSNAEDLLNFSGAGLYDSKTGQVGHKKKTVEKAIKKVWAGMYNYRAYQERSVANINENTAAMSVLVHRSFPDEDLNGVIITKNIYRSDYPGIVVNAQKGDVSTVSPPDSVQCEQFILTENSLMNPFSKKVSAKYLCYSSLHPTGPLLTYDQLLLLQRSVKSITTYYAEKKLAWDLEFKFEKNKLYIKQVRPYR